MRSKKILVFLLGFWLMGLAQCGGKDSLSSDVDFTLPKSPLVVNTDITLYPNTTAEYKVAAPWFLFTSRVQNKTSKTLVIANFIIKPTGTKNGAVTTMETQLDTTSTCSTAGSGDGRVYVATIAPGGTYATVSDKCDSTTAIDGVLEGWYVGGLPQSDDFSYAVDVEPAGWFQDPTTGEVVERLYYNSSFVTQ